MTVLPEAIVVILPIPAKVITPAAGVAEPESALNVSDEVEVFVMVITLPAPAVCMPEPPNTSKTLPTDTAVPESVTKEIGTFVGTLPPPDCLTRPDCEITHLVVIRLFRKP